MATPTSSCAPYQSSTSRANKFRTVLSCQAPPRAVRIPRALSAARWPGAPSHRWPRSAAHAARDSSPNGRFPSAAITSPSVDHDPVADNFEQSWTDGHSSIFTSSAVSVGGLTTFPDIRALDPWWVGLATSCFNIPL